MSITGKKAEENPVVIVGKLQGMKLDPPDYIALIERQDIDTLHQHRNIELLVDPSTVDKILAANRVLETLRFTISQGKIVNVAKA